MNAPAGESSPQLVRALGAWDGVLLTIGAVIGTGIFLTPGDIARAVGSPGLTIGVWVAGGLLVLAGALAYAELGAMLPRAGGLYHFLREAWGPRVAFLYGWTCLLVVMSGGIAAIAVGFGEYLGSFVPALASDRVLWSVTFGAQVWRVSGAQLAAALGIVALTAINHFGLVLGARVQGVLTVIKLGAIAALVLFGLPRAAALGMVPEAPSFVAPQGFAVWSGFGLAMIATLWTYDGWYALTLSAGEVRDPGRNLPRGLVGGVLIVMLAYLSLQWVYLQALGVAGIAGTPRAAEATAAWLFGSDGGRLMALAVVLSSFGCLAATILYSSRLYQPMAADGVFFRFVADIHPHWRTPVAALWLQSAWAIVLALTGGYGPLFTYVTFGGVLFHVLGGLALFRLRARWPDRERPYRAFGHPFVPGLFVVGMLALTANSLWSAPRESLFGLGVILAGLPAYALWRRRIARAVDAGR